MSKGGLLVILVFVVGFLAGLFYTGNFPLGTPQESVTGFVTASVREKASPSNWIDMEDIEILNDRVIVHINDSRLSSFMGTKSMDPLIDNSSIGIVVAPEEGSLQVGDIIIYDNHIGMLAHRIVRIDQNENGTFYITHGDNNPEEDPDPVTFEQIEAVLVGILY